MQLGTRLKGRIQILLKGKQWFEQYSGQCWSHPQVLRTAMILRSQHYLLLAGDSRKITRAAGEEQQQSQQAEALMKCSGREEERPSAPAPSQHQTSTGTEKLFLRMDPSFDCSLGADPTVNHNLINANSLRS